MAKKQLSSLLGLAFEGRRMTAALLKRTGGRLQVQRGSRIELALDPLTGDPELVGHEIRNHLAEVGIGERQCVVGVPLNWALTLRAKLPELAEGDIGAYLALQAEREFPFEPEDLALASVRRRLPDGGQTATVVGIPVNRLAALNNILAAAKLRPRGVTLTIAPLLNGVEREAGRVVLLAGADGIDLAIVAAGGGLTALRALNAVADPTGAVADAAAVVRQQLRITMAQLPPELRETLGAIEIFGSAQRSELLRTALSETAPGVGLPVNLGKLAPEVQLSDEARRNGAPPAAAIALAADFLLRQTFEFEFYTPRPSRFKALQGRFSSRRTAWLGGAAAALVVIGCAAFGAQYWQLSRLEADWNRIRPDVEAAEELKGKIRQFRGWFDDTPHGLKIASAVTAAFPEAGDVWATTFEIKSVADGLGRAEVFCTGKARDHREWLKMQDALRATKGVEDVKVLQVRDNPGGRDPLQFALSFMWNGGRPSGK